MEKIKAFFKSGLGHIGRVSIETLILVGLGFVFFGGFYEAMANPVQLFLMKAILVSAGIYHAHLIGKFFIPSRVNWDKTIIEQSGAYFARTGLYFIIPICYAMGG